MATYYVPNANGWQANGGGTYSSYLRIRCDTSYNAGTNQTTVVCTLEAYNNAYGWQWDVLSGGTISGNGATLYTFENPTVARTHSYTSNADTVFRQITSISNPNSWSFTVQHSGASSATFSVGVNLRLYHYTSSKEYFSYFSNLSGSVTVQPVYPSYTLSISAGTGAVVSVTRTSSPAGAATGALSNGATIYQSDVLAVSYSAAPGYDLASYSPFPGSYTVTGPVAVTATATLKTYTLSVTQGTGATATVTRNGTPLADGDTISHFDVLTITFAAATGYAIDTHTVNGVTFTSGDTYTVTGAVAVAVTATQLQFSLSISTNTGSSATVERTSSPTAGASLGVLSNGDTIYVDDVLEISFGVSVGYDLTTHTVNGVTFTSGDTLTVTGAVAVVAAATVKSYTLSISAGTGANAAVVRTSSPLGGASTGTIVDGATIYYNDELSITFSVDTGYSFATKTVNGTAVTGSSTTQVVTSPVAVATTATVQNFILWILPVGGVTITVNRTSSPKQGAATGALSNGDRVYYSDELSVTFTLQPGYTLVSRTINGTSVGAQATHTVTGTTSVASLADLNVYHLSITTSPSGVTTTILRTASPVGSGSIGQIANGAAIYYNDELMLMYSVGTGYELETHTVNGADFDSEDTVTVSGDVAVVVTATASGFVYINNEPYLVYVGNGSSYDRYLSYIGNGSSYDQY